MNLLNYLSIHHQELIKLTLQHIKLVGIASLLAVVVGLLVGVLISRPRFRRFAQVVLSLVNIGQTVPTLAVVALAMAFLGIGFRAAVAALFVYSLLPIVRNTYAGITNVEPSLIEAAKGMGMKPYQILGRIELPLSLYAIMAGVRISVVINVGTATLAFLIGGGGLGDLIFTGISMVDTNLMLAGAIPTAVLAILFDTLLGKAEDLFMPKGLKI